MRHSLLVALPLLVTVTASAALPVSTTKVDATATPEVAPTPKITRLLCKGCTDKEKKTLTFFQDRGIKDKNALATIMGNIKQESKFHPNICEGGARIPYHQCRSGGYGLIQWTTSNRYHGLGSHAKRIGVSPSTLMGQLSYLTTEPQWKLIEPKMMTPGKTIARYMNYAYSWIGWGIHGKRTMYAYQYVNKFITISL